MRYLRTYENYKSSQKFGDVISKKEYQKLYNEHCKNHDKNNVTLYRGVQGFETKDLFYQNPKGHWRNSIEDENIHIILMSELDSWKEFPKYGESVIGITNKDEADGYTGNGGTLFEIIPFDNTKIGVCSHASVWESLGGFGYSAPIKNVDRFIKDLCDVMEDTWDEIAQEIKDDFDPEKIIGWLSDESKEPEGDFWSDARKEWRKKKSNHIDKENMNMFFWLMSIDINGENSVYEDHDFIRTIKADDVIKYIERLFEPKRHGFSWCKYDENFSKNIEEKWLHTRDGVQVWCEGPVLLVPIEKK